MKIERKKNMMKSTVDYRRFEVFCESVCLKYGIQPEPARITAHMLVRTDMLGIFTHGTYSLKAYLDKIGAGGIDANALPEVVYEGVSWAIVDGHNGIAPYNNYYGLGMALRKAKEAGVAYVCIRGSGHYGAPGIYAIEAAEQGMLAIVMSNTPKNMTAPGTCGDTCGNNPIAYSVPCADRRPIFMDIGLSTVNGTKIKRVLDSGATELPLGWIVDGKGKPTTDATITDWHMAPMAGHKGFCISMLVDILSAVVSGGGLMYETKLWRAPATVPDTSHAIILLNVAQIIGLDNFKKRMKLVADDFLASPKADGVEKLYLPGDKEWAHYEHVLKNGLELPEDIFKQMIEMAEITGEDFDSCIVSSQE